MKTPPYCLTSLKARVLANAPADRPVATPKEASAKDEPATPPEKSRPELTP